MDVFKDRYFTDTTVTDKSTVLSETHVPFFRGVLIYRLSIEPRLRLRPQERTVYYTVTVIKRSYGRSARECLRDFTDDRAEAEAFLEKLAANAVMPEHLYDVYEDVFAVLP